MRKMRMMTDRYFYRVTKHNSCISNVHRYLTGTSEDEVAVHHYRSCRPEWLKPTSSFPCFNVTRHQDMTVVRLLREVENKVMDIINDIGL